MGQAGHGSVSSGAGAGSRATRVSNLLAGAWHKPGLVVFMVVVLSHWAEHIAQAVQVYVLGWPVPDARGVLGLWFPWLVGSEALHYAYALVMLVGLWVLRTGFTGRSRTWWLLAFWIQSWHHVEHALLQAQAILGANLLGQATPTSILQLWVPRVELHLFYNTVVFVPMVVAMFTHRYPTRGEVHAARCGCALRPSVPAG